MKRDFSAIAEQYIQGVMDGSILVCKTVRQAVERHLRDLENGAERGLHFEPEAGAKVCRFFESLQPSEWPAKIVLGPWQVAMILMLYGWKRANGMRRFRTAYIRLPRKTGKSALVSGFGLYALAADGERGAKVYCAALTEDQARRVFDESVAMVDQTPYLRKIITKIGDSPCRGLRVPSTNSLMKPLSRDKDTMEGLNISFASGDELHKWHGRDTYDVLRYGMRSRSQPLFITITTAPSAEDNVSICNTFDNYSITVLEDVTPDDAFFAWVTSIDPEDEWDDETKWIKACPNLGVTVKLEDMRQEALEAKNQPDSLAAFKRYSLNLRIGAVDQAIKTDDWRACGRPGNAWELRAAAFERLKGRICFGALDLALTTDTTANALVFPPMEKGAPWELLTHFWIPEDNIKERVERDRVPYDLWRDQGFLITTPGATTDMEWIAARVMELEKLFDVREWIYDPALASGLIKLLLTSGLNKDKVMKFAQTAMNYAAPCGDFTRTVIRRELLHESDPVMLWQVSNLRWHKNHTGLFMPDKLKSIGRIDGAVASIMAYGRANHPDNAELIKPRPRIGRL